MKLCECGCGQAAPVATRTDRNRGWVKGQPIRFIRFHNVAARKKSLDRSAWVVDPESACWIWQLRIDKKTGYGRVSRSGRHFMAHRYVYEQLRGPIPDGLTLDHLCRNRACVNPQHLEPVSQTENTRRGSATRLRPADVLLIKQTPGAAHIVAQQLGISHKHVQQIRRGERWRDIIAEEAL